MKRLKFLAIGSLLMFFLSSKATPNEVQTKSKINAVTVYLNGAQINRLASINLKKGHNRIVLNKLSPYLDKKSIQIKGNGDFTILSTNHQFNFLNVEKYNEEIAKLLDSIHSISKRKEVLSEKITSKTETLNFLKINQNIKGDNQNIHPDELKTLYFFYGEQIEFLRLTILEKRRNLEQKIQ